MESKILKSWVKYDATCEFPIQNIPFGVFSTKNNKARCGSAIGEYVIDLSELSKIGILPAETKGIFDKDSLNAFMGLNHTVWTKTREALIEYFREGSSTAKEQTTQTPILIPMKDVKMHLPAQIGDYTDFYSSRFHATNVGMMFRDKKNALKPNWLHLPVGYHGRASSIVVSGTDITRPKGQLRPDPNANPVFGVCEKLDFELEMAFFVGGKQNALGEPIKISEAKDRIFGMVLMNDWSARDVQKWEYVPLGPFCGKNFATTISPWIITTDALDAFKVENEKQDPKPLPYLQDPKLCAYDIKLQVSIKGKEGKNAEVVSNSNAKYLYWSFTQQLAHHSSTGCNMRPGDLLGSGTISGPKPSEYGSMLELSWGGKTPLKLADGDRSFLRDDDVVAITGYCQGKGYRVGFGECSGKVVKANSS